jgi:hypothetical protein
MRDANAGSASSAAFAYTYSSRKLKISDISVRVYYGCGVGRIQLGLPSNAKKRRISGFIPWDQNPNV